MKVLDLFSGIGGFSLGLERAGMQTIAFCEIDPVCRQVLKKHWPNVPIYEDITKLTGDQIGYADIICGGFPCQDISIAGKGAGLNGARSGLWYEFHRLIKEIKPRYAIIENVSALRARGLDEILRQLTKIGYDAEWHCIPASAVGAPHRRDRVWILAYPNGSMATDGRQCPVSSQEGNGGGIGPRGSNSDDRQGRIRGAGQGSEDDMAYSKSKRIQGLRPCREQKSQAYVQPELLMRHSKRSRETYWKTEPNMGRVVDGFSGRVDRVKQLGNSVVPQIPELIGRAIIEYEHSLG